MPVDGLRGYLKAFADLIGGIPFNNPFKDLSLTSGQPIERAPGSSDQLQTHPLCYLPGDPFAQINISSHYRFNRPPDFAS
jgi:hypothetical protein